MSSSSGPRRSAVLGAQHLPFLLILLTYLAICALYALRTPDWQAPDEPAHYNYVRQVAANGCCPLMEPGDWDQQYLEAIKAAKFASATLAGRLGSVQYEDWQPPLYYLILAPVYSLTGGSLQAMRLLSLLIGGIAVLVGWLALRAVFPAQPWITLTATAFMAFLPQRIAIMASVSNDSLAELVIALILLICVRFLQAERPGWRILVALGILLGIGFWTKLSIYPFAAVIALAIALRALHGGLPAARFRGMVGQLAFMAAISAAIAAPWWLRNVAAYGWPDFLAQNVHDRVVVGQPRTDEWIAREGVGGWLRGGVQTTFQSFWGQFGWMGVPMTGTIYGGLLPFTGFVAGGGVLAFFRWRRSLSRLQRDSLTVLAGTALIVLLTYLYYNLKFVQFQGRYLYPALLPIALCVSAGLSGWVALFPRGPALLKWAPLGVVSLLAPLAIYALFRMILPALAL